MKISFIEPHLKLYGGIRRILELSNRLVGKGHEVTIFHSDGSQCGWMRCDASIKPHRDVLRNQHEIIIYNSPHPSDYLLALKAKARLKVFYVLALYEKTMLERGIPAFYFLKSFRKAMRVHFVKKSLLLPYLKLVNATWMRRWLKEHMHIDSTLLFGGISKDIFHPVSVEKNRNEIRVLCSGDPRERKGTETINKAIKKAKRKEPRIRLTSYYGKGIPQDRMAETYGRADIFVDAQWYAGWNNPVAEAMACKIPVVCTDIGGVRDFAFHEKTALLVPIKDPEALSEAILRLINDTKLKNLLQENAWRRIGTFTWEKSAQDLEDILSAELQKL